MKHYNKFRRTFLRVAAPLLLAAALVAGCTKVDDTLGGNLIPENQQMKAGYTTLPGEGLNPRKYVETRLFQTDSIIVSNLSLGYLGSQLNDTIGLRTAGFLTQFINYYLVPEGYFGYRPIFDSAQILLSISDYGRDTLTEQTFAIYEVTSNSYLTDKPVQEGKSERDTTFYLDFREQIGTLYDASRKLFTFTLGGDNGPATEAVTLDPTPAGRDFVRRLMLQEGTYKDDYSIYSLDSLEFWVEEFKGLYICPDPDAPAPVSGKGTIYATSLDASGLSVYGRNRVENDPSLIKDTIGMVYNFYRSGASHGNVSVNVIEQDYTRYNPATAENAWIDLAQATEKNTDRPENPLIHVEGMGGVVTELTFGQPFFDALEAELDTKEGYKTLAFNQVRMSIYFTDSDYDWRKIDPAAPTKLIDEMTASPERLGLYTDYKRLTAISDYNYLYEKQYDTKLTYHGYVNRSRGCYVMDISGYVQQLWNSYLEEKQTAEEEGRAIDLDNVANRRVYLAPEAYGLFTNSFGVLQGSATDQTSPVQNNAPIRFEIAYHMIK